MKKLALSFTLFALVVVSIVSASAVPNWTGDGGKGISLTVLAPQATGLSEDQGYIPALVQGEFVSNFSNFSAISVLDWEQRDALLANMLSESYSDSVRAAAAREIGNAIPTTHFMQGNITKTATGYSLQMNIIKTADKMTIASFSKAFSFAELDNLTGIRQASLELLRKMGIILTEKAQGELAGAAAENHVTAQTALARGVTAQRQGTEVAALSYYFQAAEFDPTLLEAVNRSSILNANISSGNMGDNVRNEIHWRKQWAERLAEMEQFVDNFNKTEPMPYILSYLDTIYQGAINFQNETVTLSITTHLKAQDSWVLPLERTLQTVYDGLRATGKASGWGFGNWPRQGVTSLNALAAQRNKYSVIFELINSQNKVIGRQTLQANGSWDWVWSRDSSPRIKVSGDVINVVYFHNVSANDITDNLTIKVSGVNGTDAMDAASNGGLQISAVNRKSEIGNFTDSRDRKEYRTVKIGPLRWMAENLNYQTGENECYGNDASNCAKYGRLYNWKTAVNACPAGWRLPTFREWGYLVWVAGGDAAGKNLKSHPPAWDGTDAFGFSALPGGYYYPDFSNRWGRWERIGQNIGKTGYWWSYGPGNRNSKWRWSMGSKPGVETTTENENYGFSVRCVQN